MKYSVLNFPRVQVLPVPCRTLGEHQYSSGMQCLHLQRASPPKFMLPMNLQRQNPQDSSHQHLPRTSKNYTVYVVVFEVQNILCVEKPALITTIMVRCETASLLSFPSILFKHLLCHVRRQLSSINK